MVNITVFIPAYNEERNVLILLKSIFKTLDEHKLDGEVLFVNDGSTDKTRETAELFALKEKRLKVVNHSKRRGLTETFITCRDNAKGKIIVFLPADLESNPKEDIPKLLYKLEEGYDLVIGWRQNRKGLKRFSSKIYNWFSNILFKTNLHDSNWIKVFKKDILKDMELRSDWYRYIPILAKVKGYKIGEVGVKVYKRRYGKSKFGTSRLFIGVLDLLVLKFFISFSKKPMLAFGLMGSALMLLGFIGGAYLISIKLQGVAIMSRLPLLFLVVLLILTGIQLFALGFLAEFMSSIREDIRNRK